PQVVPLRAAAELLLRLQPADDVDRTGLFEHGVNGDRVARPTWIADHRHRPGRRTERPRDRLLADLLAQAHAGAAGARRGLEGTRCHLGRTPTRAWRTAWCARSPRCCGRPGTSRTTAGRRASATRPSRAATRTTT